MTDIPPLNLSLAPMFKAAGDPMRLDILRIMQRDSFGVLELCKVFSVQQPSMSHHLKVLSKAGLVATRREGNSIFYRRSSSSDINEQNLLNAFFALANDLPIAEELQAELNAIQASRREQAIEFFQANAHRFREQQDLIAGHRDYGSAVSSMLVKKSSSVWLEIGAGDGELVRECAAAFEKVYALDVSDEMLDQSRKNLLPELSERIEFIKADTGTAITKGIRGDVISCNMVLHHVPSPAEMIHEMAELLLPGGQLLITDLDQHDQDWARESCGDLWLGFSPDQLNEWAETAGLKQGRSEFLALRNGFGVQLREYLKV